LTLLGFGFDEAGEQFLGLGMFVVGAGQDALVGGGHAAQLEVFEGGKGSVSHKIKY
jgi:hypothetical protein